MSNQAFQDIYPDHLSYFYGCGRPDEEGMHIKSYWDGDHTVNYRRPAPIDRPTDLRSEVLEIDGRKIRVRAEVSVDGELCADSEVLAVKIPEDFLPPPND
jgi:hypothetical protein